MSVLIKGMEMPRVCGKCEFLTEGLYRGKHFPCICSVGKFPVKPSELDLRDGLCPLKEVADECEILMNDSGAFECTSCKHPMSSMTRDWKHCPYCGTVIKWSKARLS